MENEKVQKLQNPSTSHYFTTVSGILLDFTQRRWMMPRLRCVPSLLGPTIPAERPRPRGPDSPGRWLNQPPEKINK